MSSQRRQFRKKLNSLFNLLLVLPKLATRMENKLYKVNHAVYGLKGRVVLTD
jgi:hypothetical protein